MDFVGLDWFGFGSKLTPSTEWIEINAIYWVVLGIRLDWIGLEVWLMDFVGLDWFGFGLKLTPSIAWIGNWENVSGCLSLAVNEGANFHFYWGRRNVAWIKLNRFFWNWLASFSRANWTGFNWLVTWARSNASSGAKFLFFLVYPSDSMAIDGADFILNDVETASKSTANCDVSMADDVSHLSS